MWEELPEGATLISIQKVYNKIQSIPVGERPVSILVSEKTLNLWCIEDPGRCRKITGANSIGFLDGMVIVGVDSLFCCLLEIEGLDKTRRFERISSDQGGSNSWR